MNSHISIYHPDFDNKPHLRCNLCEITFKNEAKLSQHNNEIHNKKKKTFSCTFCDAKFPTNESLSVHNTKVD